MKIIHFLTFLLLCVTAANAGEPIRVADTLTDKSVTIILSEQKPTCQNDDIIVPPPLSEGNLIAIVSPAGHAEKLDFASIESIIESMGFRVMAGRHARGRHGSYSGSEEERLSDLKEALINPEVKAVICSRGGYGSVHLLDSLSHLPLRDNVKWLVGFSDISALQALLLSKGIASIHGPMGINIKYHDGEPSPSCQALFALLKGSHARYEIDRHKYNRNGSVTATLTGGNLAVLEGLAATPFDEFRRGTVLFIEDVSEPVYKIQRQLYRLKLSGILGNLSGLIVGSFSDMKTDEDFSDTETMIRDMVSDYGYPVAFGVPVGHERVNIPLIIGAPMEMTVTDNGTILSQ